MSINSYEQLIKEEAEKPYFVKLAKLVDNERQIGEVFPVEENIFRALFLTPLSNTRVVIVGQDPYFNKGQANGLCFSVSSGIAIPPSLNNIFKAIEYDTGRVSQAKESGDLSVWATQGVLLLNSVLTVSEKKPLSHNNFGWQIFTTEVIKAVNSLPHRVVFMLWGNEAIKLARLLSNANHLVLTSSHPSPLSVYRGFDKCKHFSKCNEFLRHDNINIKW